jgi:predicted nucleic acid-binding protein
VSRKWVVNASPLITLGKISGISLLERMCSDLIFPEGVTWELDKGSADHPANVWIHREGASFVRRLEEVSPLVLSWDLGKGETEVIPGPISTPGTRSFWMTGQQGIALPLLGSV